ncbi:MAG: MFS transporter [Candidatus Rokubacteria bacterium]|nr:MFS transporter [Candidatus Rokubacteria bacterium]
MRADLMSGPGPVVLSASHARYALGVLFAINLFNYVDRQIIFGVFPLVQDDLALSDAALGALGSAFMMVYMVASIPLGILGDRTARNRLIATGVAVWGAATLLSGLARSYGQLFLSRALVGIGEASYGPTATAMVSDLFPKARRGFVNGLFNAAIPLGGAIGVAVGGLVGARFGWRAAFLLVGVPSVLLTFLAWRLGDPPRGAHDVAAADGRLTAATPAPSAVTAVPGRLTGILGLCVRRMAPHLPVPRQGVRPPGGGGRLRDGLCGGRAPRGSRGRAHR